MQNQLGSYCQTFDSTLRPVLADVAAALAALDAGPPEPPLANAASQRARLADLHHHLAALCDKVRDQHAYVLIFGPLKSGKSTLMNAIAAAYVSEVSSLPAYPCLVFVSAGPQRDYVLTRYDGRTERFTDSKQLHVRIDEAHGDLARAIRTAEERGACFDPQEHFPEAIRRVDVHVPDSNLDATGAVLVDTPGLYTRMRFGYDRMTRDFRNAAACAIFVVKSDTLFLEQVFSEFQQLLDLFSRIFLVVNVDSHKRDLSPDGKLVPSLEQSEPEAVLRAFEQLAMSAPLQKAAREGRVRMYPVDLLRAGSAVLARQPDANVPAAFRTFRQDLADYLASSEYLAAFLRDSLQRGESLLAETAAAATDAEIGRLAARIADHDEQLAFLDAEQRRTRTALALDWTEAFARGQRELGAEVERFARDAGAKLLRTLGASIDTWFLSSHSLQWLIAGQWTPLLLDYRDHVLQHALRHFDQQTGQTDAGLDLPAGIAELLRRAGIDLRRIKTQALVGLGAVPWQGEAAVPVDLARLPLRRGVLDVVSFRSLDKVRLRLFGPAAAPDVKIPAKDKAARLGEPGRLFLHQCVAQFRGELVPDTAAALGQHFGARLLAAATAALREALDAYLPRLAQRQAELEAERARLRAVFLPMQQLAATAQDLAQKLHALRVQFAQEARPDVAATPDVVLRPLPRRTAEPTGPNPRANQPTRGPSDQRQPG